MPETPNADSVRSWTPKFGERVEGIYASVHNPHRFGLFVKAGRTSHGRMNAGPWWELTDGKGNFWRTRPESCRRAPIVSAALPPISTVLELPMPDAPNATHRPCKADLYGEDFSVLPTCQCGWEEPSVPTYDEAADAYALHRLAGQMKYDRSALVQVGWRCGEQFRTKRHAAGIVCECQPVYIIREDTDA